MTGCYWCLWLSGSLNAGLLFLPLAVRARFAKARRNGPPIEPPGTKRSRLGRDPLDVARRRVLFTAPRWPLR